jgi:hypothetical protein
VERAGKLLRDTVDGDERAVAGEAGARMIGTVAALTGRERYDVLETWGTVHKARYRMRLIYWRLDGGCVLVGQEILEKIDHPG